MAEAEHSYLHTGCALPWSVLDHHDKEQEPQEAEHMVEAGSTGKETRHLAAFLLSGFLSSDLRTEVWGAEE